ncbi:hypothetical protein BJ165DRAFT_1456694 [Panaeolus papilionaceus]|nr:hypothetical protein BJ165DRAFT_1456694 [Panaeolus papilionaceus]
MDVDEERPQQLDKSKGRLQILAGTIFYSPNDCRTLSSIPIVDTPNNEDARKTFNPLYEWNVPETPFAVRIRDAISPRWWTPAFGWTAFIPDYPDSITEVAAPILSPNPSPSHSRKPGEYTPPSKESNLSSQLQKAVEVLRHEFGIATEVKDPKFFDSYSYDDRQDEYRDWLFVWLGYLSSAISESEDGERWDSDVLSWHQALRTNNFNSDWVNRLMGSIVYDQSEWCRRVGTFIDLSRPNVDNPEALVLRLANWSVPVWYRWEPQYAKNPLLAPLGPLPDQIQSLQVDWLRAPLKLELLDAASLPHKSPTVPTPAYSPFFASQSVLHSCLLTDESLILFRLHKDSMHFPPDPCAKVFEWVIDEINNWTRRSLPSSWRQDVLSKYAYHQKRYDSISNEWDCWRDAKSQREHIFLAGEGKPSCLICPEGIYKGVFKATTCHYFSSRISRNNLPANQIPPYPHLPTVNLDPLSFLTSKDPKLSANRVERYILYIMHRFYGFSPSKVSFVICPGVDWQQRERFLTFLGISASVVSGDIFERPPINAAVQFVGKIFTNSLLASEFTLSGDHIANAVFKSRLSCLILIPPSNTHGALYMFDFSQKNKSARPSAPWRLTVMTAAHALLVCRLPARFFEREMAIYLALHGIPFKTLQNAATLKEMPKECRPSRLIPHKPFDYKFQDADYLEYINGAQELLSSPRCARTALMRGGFPWRVAMMYVSLYSVLDGPTGLSDSLEDMFMVTIPGTNDLYVDDALTEIEAALLCGLIHTVRDLKPTQKKLYYPPDDVLEDAGLAFGRWNTALEKLFSKWAEKTKTSIGVVDDIWEPVTYADWRYATIECSSYPNVGVMVKAYVGYENACKVFIEEYVEGRHAKKKYTLSNFE